MPEQGSRRGDAVTKASFTGPFENHPLRYGVHGLNLKDSLDVLEGWARLTNVDHDNNGELTSRPGETSFATGGTVIHSVRLLRDPQAGVDGRIWGIDTSLYKGASGALTAIDTGYSGDPLTLTPHRPPLSGDPWMFVADRSKMSKVRADGLVMPIGLPAPRAAASVALDREFSRLIAGFDTGDSTNAATWTGTAGNDTQGHVSGVGHVTDIPGPIAGNGCYFTTAVGDATSAYDSWFGRALTRDLTQLDPVGGAPGSIAASDDDILHIWMLCSHPHLVEEIRVYIVVSALFDVHTLPGTDTTGAGLNTDAYVKSFRADDFVQFIQRVQTQIDAAETARIFALRDADLQNRKIADSRTSWAVERANIDPGRAQSIQIGTGSNQWFGIGQTGSSLRRGDFKRIGITTGRDWATVTGVIVYIKHTITPDAQIIAVGLDDMYLTGGFGPDTVEPGAQPYDYRYTHYDPRTGAESNGAPEMAAANFIDTIRRRILVTPAAFGNGAVRQRFYRRGGSIIADWDFLGVNTSDGGVFTDDQTDDAILAAGTLPTDHFQAVPTVDDAGNTILAQPVAAIWGPLDGMLLACGDPYRPGHLYWSNADQPDHWSAFGNVEVCPPSEVLQGGGLIGHQAFVFSKSRLYLGYPNLAGGLGIQTAPTLCKRGLSLSRLAFAVGPGGIYFAAEDGFFVTSGGPEEWIGRDIQPLFEGVTVNGYKPIDKTVPTQISVTVWENKVYFTYQDTGGQMQTLVYAILHKFWRHYHWGAAPRRLQGEDEATLLILGAAGGAAYQHTGTSDNGTAIASTVRSGAASGGTREEKLFGDAAIDADRQGVDLTVQTFLNEETVTNLSQALTSGSGRARYILDAFGDSPQSAHSISTEVSWSSATAAPILYQLNYAITLQPDVTNRRVTNWDDLGAADEVYLTGVTFDCDTGGIPKTVIIERDFAGTKSTVATLTVNCAGRHKVKFSWPAVPANQVRVHPSSEACLFWLLYRADWIFQAEPPRIASWDIHFENKWDQYHTGLDLYCHTFGLEKRIRVSVDGVFLVNTLAGNLPYWPVTTTSRQVVHLTLPWGRGHVYHFEAIDANPGILYEHRWHLDPEPTEQANWTQNFSILGSRADKWLKAVVFECDTFGLNKTVTIEADGVVVESLTVNASGRKVVQLALPAQHLGRVWRMFPTDGNPGRLYSAQPVFDEEPFCLDRWETQETNHHLPGWFYPTWAQVVVKSTQAVILTVDLHANQTGRIITEQYEIPATGNVKQRRYVTFRAGKGVLIKYTLTSAAPFFLYRDELTVALQPWGAAQPIEVHPFGNDDQDPSRTMANAALAASTPGGTADTQR
jgi:hypothetical protein